jgi:hypothetical protein
MDFKDLAGKAGDLLGQHDDKVDEAIAKAGDLAKERFAGHDGQIDGLVSKAQAYDFGGGEGEVPAEAPAEPAPPAE